MALGSRPLVEDQTNESQAITIVVAKSSASDRERAMAEDVHTPMISCDGIPLSHDCSCSPTCSTSGDKVLNAIPQEANKSSQRHSQGEPLGTPLRHDCSVIYEMLPGKQLIWT
jgi:hypothetical protein